MFIHRQGVAVKQSIIALFLSRFTLSADEQAAIASRDVPVGQPGELWIKSPAVMKCVFS